MATVVRGVILVGHGGIPKGCPQELVTKLKRLEGQRRAAKSLPRRKKSNWIPRSANGRGRRRRIPINQGWKQWRLSCEPTWVRCSLLWPTTSFVRRPWKNRWRT